VEKKDDPITTAISLLAMKLTNCDLAIASEGSLVPIHRPFVHADDGFTIYGQKKQRKS
jgi:hypothetical protein